MSSNPIAQGTAAGGTSLAGCVLILWFLWKFFGLEFPAEVSAAFVTFVSPMIHALMLRLEKSTQADIDGSGSVGNGHGAATSSPATPSTTGEKP